MENPIYISQYDPAARYRQRGRVRAALKLATFWLCMAALCFGLAFGFMKLVVRGITIESDWRADRLCRIYEVCDPKRGP